MLRFPRGRLIVLAFATASALALGAVGLANVALIQVNSDPYSNSTSAHATQVEPDTFAYGSTIVAAFQSGRFYNGGSSNIGWATSTNSGSSWTHGFLPGTTTFASPAGIYDRISDPSVAYDASHNVWLISSLPLVQSGTGVDGVAVVVSRSTDGGLTWGNPVTVKGATGNQDFDKNWTVCDNTSTSPHNGTCYVQWDDFGNGNLVHVARSTDGGVTWTEGSLPGVGVIGGQPVVQPNGTVVMPIDNAFETSVMSLVSTNGGVNWSGPYTIASITDHAVAGGLRSGPLPSADVDAAGKVYVVWQDCRFRSRCNSNDIVGAVSRDGVNWSGIGRIPIDPVSSGVDHFIPGLAVDHSTSGSSANIALTYHFYPVSKCGRQNSSCQLDVGFISSTNGGATWSAATQLAGPMTLSWLASTNQGRMVGDYISTSFAGGLAFPVFAVANVPTAGGSDCATATPNCDEAMYAPSSGLTAAGGSFGSADLPVANAASDHASTRAAFLR